MNLEALNELHGLLLELRTFMEDEGWDEQDTFTVNAVVGYVENLHRHADS